MKWTEGVAQRGIEKTLIWKIRETSSNTSVPESRYLMNLQTVRNWTANSK